jgi:hypothetical protein
MHPEGVNHTTRAWCHAGTARIGQRSALQVCFPGNPGSPGPRYHTQEPPDMPVLHVKQVSSADWYWW